MSVSLKLRTESPAMPVYPKSNLSLVFFQNHRPVHHSKFLSQTLTSCHICLLIYTKSKILLIWYMIFRYPYEIEFYLKPEMSPWYFSCRKLLNNCWQNATRLRGRGGNNHFRNNKGQSNRERC